MNGFYLCGGRYQVQFFPPETGRRFRAGPVNREPITQYCRVCRGGFLEVALETWDPLLGKGLDDVLAAQRRVA